MRIITKIASDHEFPPKFPEISEESVRARAYEIYVQRGARDGHADGDWLTAEAELKELRSRASAALSAIESRLSTK
jgi:hypothetical protein